MMVRKADSQARKDKVLAIVVDQYTKTVMPVSSGLITRKYFIELSPATVRNILADLEEEGYLTHPHTSAGRVPTQKGYRYFVDNLMHEIQLLEEEKRRIEHEYKAGLHELKTLLNTTSQLLSNFTQYTSIVSQDGKSDTVYCHGIGYVADYPEFHDFEHIRCLLNLLEEKERILKIINRDLDRKIEILIGEEIECEDMGSCALAISRYRCKDGLTGRIALLGPTRMDYERVVSTLGYITDLISQL